MLLRVLADRRPLPCRFILRGSASPDLIRQASDSLAGRIHFVDILERIRHPCGVEKRPFNEGTWEADALAYLETCRRLG